MIPLDLANVHWLHVLCISESELVTRLGAMPWQPVKDAPNRAVFRVGPYFVKIYNFPNAIGFLRKSLANPVLKEWLLANRLYAVCSQTPPPVALGLAPQKTVFISDSVEPCMTMSDFSHGVWQTMPYEQRREVVERFARFIMDLYQAGLFQWDFNLGNILVSQDYTRFYVVDMQRAEIRKGALNLKDMARNLSCLLPCFEHIETRYVLRFFACIIRKFPELKLYLHDIQDWAFARMRHQWLKKTSRKLRGQSCHIRQRDIKGYCLPDIPKKLLASLSTEPNRLFEKALRDYKDSKRGRVSLIDLNGEQYVLKRYNINGFWHALRRSIWTSISSKVWYTTLLFSARRLKTPRILGVVNMGKGLSYNASFAVYDYVPGAEKSKDLVRDLLSGPKRGIVLKKLATVLWQMHQRGVFHGDAKVSNFIWTEKSGGTQIHVIDLDSVRFKRRVTRRERLSDLKDMAASLVWWQIDDRIVRDFLDEYVGLHVSWKQSRDAWLKRLEKDVEKQVKHRRARQK